MRAVRYVGANCAWQLRGDAHLLRELADDADVLLLVECRTRDNQPLDVARFLGRGWLVQQDTTSGAMAGSVTAVRTASGIEVLRSRLVLLSPRGRGVQARFQRVTILELPDGDVVEVAAGHLPLPATGQQGRAESRAAVWRHRAERRAAAHGASRRRRGGRRWLWMGDANQAPDEFAARLRAPHYFGIRPMVACWSRGWGLVETTSRREAGSDHAVLSLTQITSKEHR